MAKPVSPQNSNLKDLQVGATTGGVIILPRLGPAVASAGLDYNVGAQVVGAAGPAADVTLQADPGGAIATLAEEMAMADAGAYFRAGNATIGTALTYAIQTSFSATVAALLIVNASAKRVYLDYIRMLLTIAPASATAGDWAVVIDPTNRFSSGGTVLGGANTSMLATANGAPGASAYWTPTVAAAGANARTVARGKLRTVIPVAGDTFIWQFGMPPQTSQVINGANPTILAFGVPPVVLPATSTMLLHLWFVANAATAPTFEVEVGWWER